MLSRRAAEFPPFTHWLLLLIMVMAPLPLASNRPFFEGLIGLGAGAALFVWSLHVLRTGQGQLTTWQLLRRPALCILPVLLWSLLQAATVSITPMMTVIGLMRIVSFLILFLLAYQMGRSHTLARRFLTALALSSAGYALYGLVNYASGNAYILWLPKWSHAQSLTATFVNRNAFAAYCGMGILASATLLTMHFKRGLTTLSWVIATGAAILLLALALSDSRAGVVSVACGLGVFWLGLFLNKTLPRKQLFFIAGGGAVLGLLALLIAGQGLLSRLSTEVLSSDERTKIWGISGQMIKDAPLTGHGLNTYGDLFLQYRDETIAHSYTRAHSAYLELAVEWGVPMAALWFCAFAFIGWQLLKGIRTRRQNALYPILAFAILAQAAVHSLLDFSFQTPANVVVLAIVLGLGMAQSYSSTEQTR